MNKPAKFELHELSTHITGPFVRAGRAEQLNASGSAQLLDLFDAVLAEIDDPINDPKGNEERALQIATKIHSDGLNLFGNEQANAENIPALLRASALGDNRSMGTIRRLTSSIRMIQEMLAVGSETLEDVRDDLEAIATGRAVLSTAEEAALSELSDSGLEAYDLIFGAGTLRSAKRILHIGAGKSMLFERQLTEVNPEVIIDSIALPEHYDRIIAETKKAAPDYPVEERLKSANILDAKLGMATYDLVISNGGAPWYLDSKEEVGAVNKKIHRSLILNGGTAMLWPGAYRLGRELILNDDDGPGGIFEGIDYAQAIEAPVGAADVEIAASGILILITR